MTFALLAVGLLGAASVSAPAHASEVSDHGCDPIRVLFVGNSRIYYFNQPAIVAELAAANGCSVSWRMEVEGGATLGELLDRQSALAAIRSGGWDYIVFNAQSTWGEVFLVDGLERVRQPPARFLADLRSFRDAAREAGAEPLLLLQPRAKEAPGADVLTLYEAGRSIETELDVRVIPVGMAWEEPALDDLELYDPDGSHPSALGALLSAHMIHLSLFGELPAQVPEVFRGPEVDKPDGTVHLDSVVDLVAASPKELVRIARGATDAQRRWAAAESPPIRNTDPVIPTLPKPDQPLEISQLAGSWSGDLKLYPRYVLWPAKLHLQVRHKDSRLTAAFRLSFDGRPSDIVYENLPISFEGDNFQFVDPDGPDGSIVRYRIVPLGPDAAAGIAEFISDEELYGIGSVTLRRDSSAEPKSD